MSLSAEITREILWVGLVLLVVVFNFLTIPCLMLWLHSNLEIQIHLQSVESEASRRRHFIRLHERLTSLENSRRVVESDASRRRHFIRLHERLTSLENSRRVIYHSAAGASAAGASAATNSAKLLRTGNRCNVKQ